MVVEGAKPGSRGVVVQGEVRAGEVTFTVTPELSGRWVYVVPEADR